MQLPSNIIKDLLFRGRRHPRQQRNFNNCKGILHGGDISIAGDQPKNVASFEIVLQIDLYEEPGKKIIVAAVTTYCNMDIVAALPL